MRWDKQISVGPGAAGGDTEPGEGAGVKTKRKNTACVLADVTEPSRRGRCEGRGSWGLAWGTEQLAGGFEGMKCPARPGEATDDVLAAGCRWEAGLASREKTREQVLGYQALGGHIHPAVESGLACLVLTGILWEPSLLTPTGADLNSADQSEHHIPRAPAIGSRTGT